MVNDGLATQGAKASAAMVLTHFSQNILVTTLEELIAFFSNIYHTLRYLYLSVLTIKEVTPSLAKPPLKLNSGLAKLGLTTLANRPLMFGEIAEVLTQGVDLDMNKEHIMNVFLILFLFFPLCHQICSSWVWVSECVCATLGASNSLKPGGSFTDTD